MGQRANAALLERALVKSPARVPSVRLLFVSVRSYSRKEKRKRELEPSASATPERGRERRFSSEKATDVFAALLQKSHSVTKGLLPKRSEGHNIYSTCVLSAEWARLTPVSDGSATEA